nr:MAG TPA: hypothetical protein [Caudoviricetes sp.]
MLKITLLRYVSPILLLEIEIRTFILDCPNWAVKLSSWWVKLSSCRGQLSQL